ncbi:hypothetical protein CHCC20335_1356 [Bacillus paralicheniformis]|nr:hypothetical protein CHCC20335_1356 [Bacillus paralicheniformis]
MRHQLKTTIQSHKKSCPAPKGEDSFFYAESAVAVCLCR